jgi:hypothetical protein
MFSSNKKLVRILHLKTGTRTRIEYSDLHPASYGTTGMLHAGTIDFGETRRQNICFLDWNICRLCEPPAAANRNFKRENTYIGYSILLTRVAGLTCVVLLCSCFAKLCSIIGAKKSGLLKVRCSSNRSTASPFQKTRICSAVHICSRFWRESSERSRGKYSSLLLAPS